MDHLSALSAGSHALVKQAHASQSVTGAAGVHHQLLYAARVCNDRNPFVALPLSVLREIVQYMELAECDALLKTCRSLHSLVHSAELWATRRPFRKTLLDGKLVLSGYRGRASLILRLDFVIKKENALLAPLYDVLAQYLPRVQHLNVQIAPSRQVEAITLTIWPWLCETLICTPAPGLQSFRLSPWPISKELAVLNHDIFAGNAPELRSCAFWQINLPSSPCAALAAVTSLSYAPISGSVSPSELLQLVDNFPALQHLFIRASQFPNKGETDHRLALPPTRNLRWFRLNSSGSRTGMTSQLLRCALHLGIEQLALCDAGSSWAWWMDMTRPFWPKITTLSLGRTVSQLQVSLRWNGSEYSHRVLFQCISRHIPTRLASPILYTHLTALAVHEFYWPVDKRFPEARALTFLRLWLACPHEYQELFNPSRSQHLPPECGIFRATSKTAWCVPSLQSLHIAYGLPTVRLPFEPLTVSLAEIHEFISRCLLYDGPRLQRLTITGVEPIDVSVEAVALLQLSADRLDIDSLPDSASNEARLRRDIWHDSFSIFTLPSAF